MEFYKSVFFYVSNSERIMETEKGLNAKIANLEIAYENLEERVDEHEHKLKQAEPVLTHAANQNVLFWSAIAITILNLLLLVLKG